MKPYTAETLLKTMRLVLDEPAAQPSFMEGQTPVLTLTSAFCSCLQVAVGLRATGGGAAQKTPSS